MTRNSLNHILMLWILFLMLLCLCGCAKRDAVSTIVDTHIAHVDEVLDYAKGFETTADVKYLTNELKSCKNGLVSAGQAHNAVLATCESEVRYWKLSTFFIGAIAGLLLFFLIKRR